MNSLFGEPRWSNAELAEVFGISPQRLGVLCKTGVLPLATDGLHDPKLAVAAYVRHLKQREEGRSQAGESMRKIQLENEIRMIKLQRLAGELIPVDRVQTDWFDATRLVRDGLLNLPSRLSGVFAAETSQEKIFAAFTAEVQEVLANLSREQTWQPADHSGAGLSPPAHPGDEAVPADGRQQDQPDTTGAMADEAGAAPVEPLHTADVPDGARAVDVDEGPAAPHQAERFATGD